MVGGKIALGSCSSLSTCTFLMLVASCIASYINFAAIICTCRLAVQFTCIGSMLLSVCHANLAAINGAYNTHSILLPVPLHILCITFCTTHTGKHTHTLFQ